MKPYYADALATLYCGDCLEVLPSLGEASAGVVVTDPPYNIGKRYGAHDDRQEHPAYVAWLSGVFGQCARVTRGGLVYFPGQMVRNVLSVGDALRGTGFAPYRLLGWHRKEYAGDKWHGGPAMAWEPVVWAGKAEKPFYRKQFGWRGRDFLVVPSTRGDPFKRRHPCPKPVVVMAWLVGLFCPDGGPALDPFAGTGASLWAAKSLGFPSVGIEIEERYCEAAAKRLEQGVLDFAPPGKEPT